MIGVLLALTAVVGCTSPAAIHPKPAADDRPNFVFVLTDDLSWNLVSHMPNLLALQQAGTTMSRYYVVDSLCCPSRSAIFTGQYPHDDGEAHFNAEQNALVVKDAEHYYRTMVQGGPDSWNVRDRHMTETLDAKATLKVANRCIRLLSLPQPKIISPRKPASYMKAVIVS